MDTTNKSPVDKDEFALFPGVKICVSLKSDLIANLN